MNTINTTKKQLFPSIDEVSTAGDGIEIIFPVYKESPLPTFAIKSGGKLIGIFTESELSNLQHLINATFQEFDSYGNEEKESEKNEG